MQAFTTYESYMVHRPVDDELEFLEELFVSSVVGLKVSILAALEAAGLADTRTAFAESFATFDISETRYESFNAVMYSPVLEMTRDYVRTLTALTGAIVVDAEKQDRRKLEQILSTTAVFLRDQGVDPSTEADVQRAMRAVLKSVFPDTVSEVPIAKVTKTYKPDFGIPSLRAAIEYKFCASSAEVGKALGGIYEDIHGYAGSRDWEWFYAVIYMTEAFIAPQHAEAEFRLGSVTKYWKPIVVVGSGQRQPRKRRNSRQRVTARQAPKSAQAKGHRKPKRDS